MLRHVLALCLVFLPAASALEGPQQPTTLGTTPLAQLFATLQQTIRQENNRDLTRDIWDFECEGYGLLAQSMALNRNAGWTVSKELEGRLPTPVAREAVATAFFQAEHTYLRSIILSVYAHSLVSPITVRQQVTATCMQAWPLS